MSILRVVYMSVSRYRRIFVFRPTKRTLFENPLRRAKSHRCCLSSSDKQIADNVLDVNPSGNKGAKFARHVVSDSP